MLVVFITEIHYSASQALGNQEYVVLFPFEKLFNQADLV